MGIWMVYDREGLARNAAYVELYRKHSRRYGMDVTVVLADEVYRRVSEGERPACVFVRTMRPAVSEFLEAQGIPVFNPSEVSRVCNDKGRTLARFRERVLSVPSITLPAGEWQRVMETAGSDAAAVRRYFSRHFTYLAFGEWERVQVEEAEDFVLKTADGHGGSEVYSFCGEQERIRREEKKPGEKGISGRNMVLQPLIKGGSTYRDMRVYVIGKRIVAAVMRSSEKDFRANFSRGGQVELVTLNNGQREVADRIIREMDFGMVGIDFLFDREGRMVLNEIEDVAGARMLYECAPETDIVQQYLEYAISRINEK